MEDKNYKKYHLLNSSLGLLPWLFVVIAQNNIPYLGTVIVAAVSWTVLFIYFYKIKENHTTRIMLRAVGGVLLINAAAPLFHLPEVYATLFSEVLLFLFLLFFNHFKQEISNHYLRFESSFSKREKRISLNGLFYIANICQSALFIHLVIAFAFFLLSEKVYLDPLKTFVYEYMGILLLSIVIVYEHIRLSFIKKKLSRESWLPVTNETGRIIGRVAKSVSLISGNRFLHPLIRIALIYKGKLFLSERPQNYVIDPGKLDYPFEKHLKFDQSLDDAVSVLLHTVTNIENIKSRFVFKHLYKSCSASRLVYLYTIPVHDKEFIEKMQLPMGRIWTEKQIEDNLHKGIFSELFETEYEILKNTILMAERIIYEKHS